jgi:hypothetical protein
LPVNFPGRSEAIKNLSLALNEMSREEDAEFLPPWLKNTTKLAQKMIQRPGEEPVIEQKRIRTSTINPFQTFVDERSALGMTHPVVQALLTAMQQRDVQSGRPISAPGVSEEFVSGIDTKYNPRTGKEEIVDQRAPFMNVLMGQVAQAYPPAKYAGMAIGGGRMPDTAIPPFSNQTIMDQRTGKPRFPNKWMDEIIRYFGPSVTGVEDVEGQVERRKAGLNRNISKRFNQAIQNPNNLKAARQKQRYGRVQNPAP